MDRPQDDVGECGGFRLEPCAVSPAPRGTRDPASRGIPRDPARTFLRDGAGAGLFDFFAGRERDPAEQ